VFEEQIQVEGIEARLAPGHADIRALLSQGMLPVCIDPEGKLISALRPDAVVDARLAKCNLGTRLSDAPIVIGLGPGFTAGQDVHAVIETMRGHNLGRILYRGTAEPDTHVPSLVLGHGRDRVLWAPCAGRFRGRTPIGEHVEAGQTVADVSEEPVRATISGVLRGILYDGLVVREGQKVGDIDLRGLREYCFTISDKARAIGGSVLEAILYLRRHLTTDSTSAKL